MFPDDTQLYEKILTIREKNMERSRYNISGNVNPVYNEETKSMISAKDSLKSILNVKIIF